MGWSASTKMIKTKPRAKAPEPEARVTSFHPQSLDEVLESLGLNPKKGPSPYDPPSPDGVCAMEDRVEIFVNPGEKLDVFFQETCYE